MMGSCCYKKKIKVVNKVPKDEKFDWSKLSFALVTVNKLKSEKKDKILKKLRHIHCHCNVKHETFVFTCQEHPTIYPLPDDMVQKCFCKNVGPYDLCSSCVGKRYIINFRTMKFCMRKIPSYLKTVVVNFNYFFKRKITLQIIFLYLEVIL